MIKKFDFTVIILTFFFVFLCFWYINQDVKKYQIRPCKIETPVESKAEKVNTDQPVEKPAAAKTEPDVVTQFTDEDQDLLVRVVMSEGGSLPMEGKIAILSAVMNRVKSDKFPNTIRDVVTQEGQFSLADNGEPNEECYLAVDWYQDGIFPESMFYFRNDYPHSFGYFYMKIGNMYFNTDENIY